MRNQASTDFSRCSVLPATDAVLIVWVVSGARTTRRELILIVDDDPAMRTSLAELLSECGYDTLTECDGTTALDLLTACSPSEEQPSVMLVDV